MIISPEAQRDIDEAVAWYDEQREGLGDEFLDGLDQVFEQIQRRPELHGVVLRNVRLALVPRFPYAVYYRVAHDEVSVVAVMHGRRDSRHWTSRI